jgi:hypothetical protein
MSGLRMECSFLMLQRLLFLTVLLGLTLTGRDAQADRLLLLPNPELLKRSLENSSANAAGISEEELRERIYKPALMARLKKEIAPVKFQQNRLGTYIDGIVLDYLPGPRAGDPMDPDNWDTIIFQPQGPGGKTKSAEPITISARRVMAVQYTVDWPNDFVWEMSDRHRRLGVPFGSEDHRQSIYAVVDPDGELGLYKGELEPVQVAKEGRVLGFLLNGLPSMESYLSGQTWNLRSPYLLKINAGAGTRSNAKEYFSPINAIRAMGRAGKYDNFDQYTGEMAADLVKLYCSFALADPAFASARNQVVAERAFYLGVACRESVSWLIEKAAQKSRGDVYPDPPDDFLGDASAFQIKDQDLVNPLLQMIIEERSFRAFIGAEIQFYVSSSAVDVTNAYWQTSGLMMRALAELAFGGGTGVSSETKSLAQIAFIRLVAEMPGDPPGDAEYFEIDRRVYRDVFEDWSRNWKNPKGFTHDPWIIEVYCALGWGYGEDIERLAESLTASADRIAYAKARRRTHSEAPIEEIVQALILMQRNGNGSSGDTVIAKLIDDWVEYHQKATMLPIDSSGNTFESRFLMEIYNEIAKQDGTCPALK